MEEVWKEYTHADGRKYYHNPVTGETRWDNPNEALKAAPAAVAPQSRPTEDELEEGWIEYKNPEGKSYYHNPTMNETRWEKPVKISKKEPPPRTVEPAVRKAPAPVQTPEAKEDEWKEYETEDGRKYFHNTRTGVTKWTKPDTARAPVKKEVPKGMTVSQSSSSTEIERPIVMKISPIVSLLCVSFVRGCYGFIFRQ